MKMHSISPRNLVSMFTTDGKRASGGVFTVRSKETGKDYTFRIAQVPFKGFPYLHIKVEKGYMDFAYMGYFRDGGIVKKDRLTGTTVRVDTPAASAISWLLRMLKAGEYTKLERSIDVFHLGKCLKCGRALTDAVSIETGFGPVCRHL